MERSTLDWHSFDDAAPQASSVTPEAPRVSRLALLGAAALSAAALLGAAALLIATTPRPELAVEGATGWTPTSPSARSASAVASRSPGGDLLVDVEGAVRRPGVHRVPAGSRVADAIAAAGGFGPRVDAKAVAQELNLAAAVRDGDKLHVPELGVVGTPRPTGGGAGEAAVGATRPAASGLVDLNRATAAELDQLPGVGPATAAKIIAAREEAPFRSVDELRSRKLVSASVYEQLKDRVSAGG